MATTFIRAFVIMLALTGFGATTYTAGSSGTRGGAHTMDDDGGPVTGSPTPTCPPSDPNHCGMD